MSAWLPIPVIYVNIVFKTLGSKDFLKVCILLLFLDREFF